MTVNELIEKLQALPDKDRKKEIFTEDFDPIRDIYVGNEEYSDSVFIVLGD